jgi:hypothetical protein
MRETYDSLKVIVQGPLGTVGQGFGAILLSLWEALPDILRVLILFASFIHIVVKVRKEF